MNIFEIKITMRSNKINGIDNKICEITSGGVSNADPIKIPTIMYRLEVTSCVRDKKLHFNNINNSIGN